MLEKLQTQFPKGTPVRIQKESKTGTGIYWETEVFGTVISWRHEGTGAWYAKNGDQKISNKNGKLQLLRLKLTKIEGEITDIIIDDLTKIAKIESKGHDEKRTLSR